MKFGLILALVDHGEEVQRVSDEKKERCLHSVCAISCILKKFRQQKNCTAVNDAAAFFREHLSLGNQIGRRHPSAERQPEMR
jgi:hypothetical protein